MRPGIRLVGLTAALAVAALACGGENDDAASGDALAVDLEADEYTFRADEAIEIRAGDTVTFTVSNVGVLDHQLEVLSAESRSLGSTGRISPGDEGSITVTFEAEGVYRVICDIDDHLTRGQQARFEVLPAGTG